MEGTQERDKSDGNPEILLSRTEMEFTSLTVDQMESQLEIGQPMKNENVAYGLYCIYAKAKGFSVRKDIVLKFLDGSGDIKAREFVCSCAGKKDEKRSKENVPTTIKPTYRCECKAKIRVARLKGQNWRITAFRKDHNHDMYSSSESHLLRSARHVNSEIEDCIESLVKCGVLVARAYEFLETQSHGREHVDFTRKDVYNALNRSREIMGNGDATKLIEFFASKTKNEPYFYWNVEKDENDRLINFFYRDFRCSVDYEYFGDLLSFDTTYRTNKYNMIACPFVGINHHNQSILFGYAYMSDETESSFEWLFRTFLDSMGGKQPESIFTDQCQAMMNAIATVFPESQHRLCQWHISQNTPSHFGWRSDDANSALKRKGGSATSCLHDCVVAYEKVQESWRMDEVEKDCMTHHGRLPTGKNPWLIQAAKMYTMEIFILFEKEVRDLIDFSITKYQAIPNTSIEYFEVTPRDGKSRSFEVQLNISDLRVSCGCHKFESFGILCSHVLKVFDRVDLNFIPEHYIKRRWSKAATNRISDGRRTNKSSGAAEMIFINEMMKKCYIACTRANRCNETRLILAESFENGIEKMNAWFDNMSINEVNVTVELDEVRNLSQAPETLVRDPLNVKAKGVTDVRARHWDDKKRKAKGKRAATRAKKRQVQSSHRKGEEFPSQKTQDEIFLQHAGLQHAGVSQPDNAYISHPQTSFTALLNLHQAGAHH